MPRRKSTGVVDVGGTWIRVGTTSQSECVRFAASSHYDRLLASIRKTVIGLKPQVERLYMSAPGLIDFEGRSRRALYSCIDGHNIREDVETQLSIVTTVENDARSQALGCMKPEESLVYICFGTGVGGTAVLQGQPLRGRDNLAGEFGHVSSGSDRWSCTCGRVGCLDAVAGGRSLEVMLGRDWYNSKESGKVDQAMYRAAQAACDLIDVLNGLFRPDRIVLAGHLPMQSTFAHKLKCYSLSCETNVETISDTWPLVLRWASSLEREEFS
jgi:predicted NBD/HSP70 family sugar kinase